MPTQLFSLLFSFLKVLPSPDSPLLRMRGRYLSVDAAMPTMNSSNLQQIRSERGIYNSSKARSQSVIAGFTESSRSRVDVLI